MDCYINSRDFFPPPVIFTINGDEQHIFAYDETCIIILL